MTIHRWDIVKRVVDKSNKIEWTGTVLCDPIPTIKSGTVVIVELDDGRLFVSDPDSLEKIKEFDCKHDRGFVFIETLWHCRVCGFTLNFHPDKFPGGVVYTDKPNFTKIAPKLVPSKK